MADAPSPRLARTPAGPDPSTHTHTLSKRRALFELVIGYGLILLVIWANRPLQRPLYLLALLVIAIIIYADYTTPQAMGLRVTNFARSLWIVAVALLISAISVTTAIHCHTLHPTHGPVAFFKRYCGYALWSFVQQILLQDVFLRRLQRLLPSAGLAALATAIIFSIAHLPSPVLTVVTFVFGLAACLVFLRYRNLYPLAIAHAILGVTIAITLPNSVIRNMRVGLGYIHYGHQHHLSHSDHVVSTRAWVIADAPTLRC